VSPERGDVGEATTAQRQLQRTVLSALRRLAAEERRHARRGYDLAILRHNLIVSAIDARCSRAEVGKALGVSRQAVDNFLRRRAGDG
jgi:hypothetical protein